MSPFIRKEAVNPSGQRGIGGHSLPNRGASDDWLTPPHIIEEFGPFDLDPCASRDQPWPTAETQFTIDDDGLRQPWEGFVWCNPPYGPDTWNWLSRMAEHRNGIALIFARTETTGFFAQVWHQADALLFLEGRLFFHHPVTGKRGASNAGGPSVLVAYGEKARGQLRRSGLSGAFVSTWGVIS